MSEKRFILDSDFVKVTSQVAWDNQEEKGLTLMKLVDLLNEQQDQIIYWKHKVYSLLWILSQFDKEKVKKLLKELDDE